MCVNQPRGLGTQLACLHSELQLEIGTLTQAATAAGEQQSAAERENLAEIPTNNDVMQQLPT